MCIVWDFMLRYTSHSVHSALDLHKAAWRVAYRGGQPKYTGIQKSDICVRCIWMTPTYQLHGIGSLAGAQDRNKQCWSGNVIDTHSASFETLCTCSMTTLSTQARSTCVAARPAVCIASPARAGAQKQHCKGNNGFQRKMANLSIRRAETFWPKNSKIGKFNSAYNPYKPIRRLVELHGERSRKPFLLEFPFSSDSRL